MDLSFIGWYFVGALCFGLGTLFVTPYHEVARVNFYVELKMEEDGFYGNNDNSNGDANNNDGSGANDVEWF